MRRGAMAIFGGTLLLAGCGGEQRPQQPTTDGSGGELTVTETEFELHPTEARIARPGAVDVAVVNRGQTVHALALKSGGGVRSTGSIEPGQTQSLTADLPPGRYTWYCPVGDHRQRGMQGTLTVSGETTEREPSAPGSTGGGYGY